MASARLLRSIKVHNELGEGIIWNAQTQTVWWTDIHSALLYQYDPEIESLRKFALPERLCSFGFIKDSEKLICAFASGFAYYNPNTTELEWLYRPEKNYRGTRFNDGRVDRQGRFWSGTMVEGYAGNPGRAVDEDGQDTLGSLYWVSNERFGKALDNIHITNSLCWTLDSSALYLSDTPKKRIQNIAFDPTGPTLGAATTFAHCGGDENAGPDGATVDAEGYLWNAEWGNGRLVRYNPQGEMVFELKLPVTQPTCLCFGGKQLDTLFVTSAREHLSKRDLSVQPEAGNVFVFKTDFRGLEESFFSQ